LFFVGANNFQAGQMGGQAVAKQLNGKGNIVVYLTAGQANMEERLAGYRSALAQDSQLKIVDLIDLKGDPRVAFDKTKEILAKGKPAVDAFVSMEAQSAKEVAEVLGRNKTKKVVISMDALPATLEGIENGGITATIAQKPFTMGYSGLRLIADLYLNKLPSLSLDFAANPNSPLPRFVDTGVALIDKSNIGGYREASKSNQSKGN
jgi:ribose transport system substrate-binding protein